MGAKQVAVWNERRVGAIHACGLKRRTSACKHELPLHFYKREGTSKKRHFMIFIQFLNGLSTSMLLFLLASGLTLIFGVLRIINFAHGSFYMLGAYLTYTISRTFANYWVAFLVAPIFVAISAGLIE